MTAIKIAAAAMGRKGGASKSPAKVQAARENGKMGGRPKLYTSENLKRKVTIPED